MKKAMLFVLITSTMMFSCSDDDSPQINPKLNNTWEMIFYGAYMPETPEINTGDIQWNIKLRDNKLMIANNIEEQYPYILPSGNYDINITHNTIIILGTTYDYTIENDTLIVSNNPELDGPLMKFIVQ